MALTNAASTLEPPRTRARSERNGRLAFVADPAAEEAVAKAAAELRLGSAQFVVTVGEASALGGVRCERKTWTLCCAPQYWFEPR